MQDAQVFFKPEIEFNAVGVAFVGLGEPGGWSPQPCIIQPVNHLQLVLSHATNFQYVVNGDTASVQFSPAYDSVIFTARPTDPDVFAKSGPRVMFGTEALADVRAGFKHRLNDDCNHDVELVAVENVYTLRTDDIFTMALRRTKEKDFFMASVAIVLDDASGSASLRAFDMADGATKTANVFDLRPGRRAVHFGGVQIHMAGAPCGGEKQGKVHHHFMTASEMQGDETGIPYGLEEIAEQLRAMLGGQPAGHA